MDLTNVPCILTIIIQSIQALAIDTTMLAIDMITLAHAKIPLVMDTSVLRGCKIKCGRVKQTLLQGC